MVMVLMVSVNSVAAVVVRAPAIVSSQDFRVFVQLYWLW
jgi:hypothetical protein